MPIFGEVAYEVLYWLPYVNRLLEDFKGTIVYWGRDGSETWFQSRVGNCVVRRNMFEVVDREWFFLWQSEEHLRKNFKQIDRSRNQFIYDSLLSEVQKTAENASTIVITPEPMYHLVAPAIADPFGIRWPQIKGNFEYRQLQLGESGRIANFPNEFNLVRLYSKGKSLDFSKSAVRSKAIEAIFSSLDSNKPLIDLTPPEDFQDHLGWRLPPTIAMSAWDLIPYNPYENLLLQSVILSHCSALLASHGGIAYLAIMLGIPTFAVEGSETPIFKVHRQALSCMVKTTGSGYHELVIA